MNQSLNERDQPGPSILPPQVCERLFFRILKGTRDKQARLDLNPASMCDDHHHYHFHLIPTPRPPVASINNRWRVRVFAINIIRTRLVLLF